MDKNDFRNYAVHHLGMNGLALDNYTSATNSSIISSVNPVTASYISPTIIEERQLNVAQMDVFSRLMMDRIIFLEDGAVTAVGAHAELYESCPAYHHMVELQKLEEEGAKHNA